nr:ribosomal protein S3 [Coccidia sp. AB-2023a]
MGQKVSPLIFRSQLYPYYKNIWYGFKHLKYNNYLNNYIFIKNLLQNLINNLDILGIRIQYNNKFNINLNIILPKVLFKSDISNNLSLSINNINTILTNKVLNNLKFLNDNSIYKVSINFCVLKQPLLNPELLNYFIKTQLIKSEPLRKILKNLIKLISLETNSSIRGLKILISGRINGIKRARKETLKIGNLPLQNLNYNITYNLNYVKTSYGILGIKLWLFIY